MKTVPPTRVLDKRFTPLGSGQSVDVQVTGVAGVPASGVAAVVLNLTAVQPTTGGFLTAYPAGVARPLASTLNFVRSHNTANEVIAKPGSGGDITIFNSSGQTGVLVDVTGWFDTNSYFTGLNPARVLDTRTGNGAAKAPVSAGHSIDVQISGRGGVPATGATAVAVNLTATAPTSGTFVTEYPAGEPRPTTSNLNLLPGQTSAVLVVAKLGTGGRISLYNNTGTIQLVADVTGWFSATGQFTPITPTRALDTRKATSTSLGEGERRSVDLTAALGGANAPDSLGAVVVSVTAVGPTGSGFLTTPAPVSGVPTTSTLNFVPGQTVSNLVIVPTGFLGNSPTPITIGVFNSTGFTDVLVDVLGWFASDVSFFLPTTTQNVTVPAPVNQSFEAFGGVAPLTWSVVSGTLPDGLHLDSTGARTAAITGVPTTSGLHEVIIRVADASGMLLDRMLTMNVAPFVSGAVWLWSKPALFPSPHRLTGLSGATAIAAAGNSAYSLETDGTVRSWVRTVNDTSTTPVQVPGLAGVTAIAAGGTTGYALRSDRTVWSWTQNTDGTTTAPVQVIGLTGVTSISAGTGTGYALKADGTAWAWGDNTHGQLGNGTTDSSSTPVQVSGLTGITAIAGGSTSGYALTSAGTVQAWGDNTHGQLGNGTRTDSSTPVQVSGLAGVTSIAGGTSVGYAIASHGVVWDWGLNTSGQLGNRPILSHGTPFDSTVPLDVSGLIDVVAVAGNADSSFALTADGTTWAWGRSGVSTLAAQYPGVPQATALAGAGSWVYALGTP